MDNQDGENVYLAGAGEGGESEGLDLPNSLGLGHRGEWRELRAPTNCIGYIRGVQDLVTSHRSHNICTLPIDEGSERCGCEADPRMLHAQSWCPLSPSSM
ncbi:hypothetical protein M3J09_003780 [Ascochyta lentis]